VARPTAIQSTAGVTSSELGILFSSRRLRHSRRLALRVVSDDGGIAARIERRRDPQKSGAGAEA
jgi:hypothetical protein